MLEVKLSRLSAKLNKYIQEKALSSLNRRSIRNIEKYTKRELEINHAREFLDKMESQLEEDYQKADAEIKAAYQCVRENNPTA